MPNLSTLLLTNNKIASFADIDSLAKCHQLTLLVLRENPITMLPNYRLYVIYKVPSLKCLDYVKVKKAEREAAQAFFASNEGKQVLEVVHATATSRAAAPAALTDAQRAEIRAAIAAATTKEEMDRIEKQLKVLL